MAPHLSRLTFLLARAAQRRSQPALGALRARAPSALLAALLLACGGSLDSQNLGDTANESPAEASLSPAPLEDFMGSWIGEAEDPLGAPLGTSPATYHFPSGSKLFRLVLLQTDYASVHGALTFGEGTRPPPPMADAGYPPSVDYTNQHLYDAPQLPPVEGHIYRVAQMPASGADDNIISNDEGSFSLRDGVLQIGLDVNEPIGPWCALQSSLPLFPWQGDSGYSCVGDAYRNPPSVNAAATCFSSAHGTPFFSPDDTPVDCGKYYLCAWGSPPICACDGTTCQLRSDSVDLFLRADGTDLVGVFSNGVFARADGRLAAIGSVRFHRASVATATYASPDDAE